MSLPKYVVLDKKVGETPLMVQEGWRTEHGISKDVSLAYAGRLDPMASGKLLILVGDECKKQDQYLRLDKEYEFEVLFGFKSDSGDVLGLAEQAQSAVRRVPEVSLDTLRITSRKLVGEIELPYPVFSSKPVDGKPLFMWKLENKLDEIEIPTKQSEIFKLEVISERILSAEELQGQISEKINSIPEVTEESKRLGADFRRDTIRKQWDALFASNQTDTFQVVKFKCVASSGTYMRTLAEHIAERVGTYGLAFSIHRTEIGKYQKFGPLQFWSKRF